MGLSWDDVWSGVGKVGGAVGDFVYEALPIDNAKNIYDDFRTGNVDWGTLADATIGALETAGLVTGVGAVARGVAAGGLKGAATALGKKATERAFANVPILRSTPLLNKLPNWGLPALSFAGNLSNRFNPQGADAGGPTPYTPYSQYANIARQMGSGATGNYGLGVGPSSSTMTKPAGAYGSADTMERRQGVRGPATVAGQPAAPRNSAGTFAAIASSIGSQLAALSPEMQAQLDEARSQALRDYQLVQAQADMARKAGSLQAQEQLRAAGRAGVGQAADFRQIASELGFGSSPAAYGVGLDEIAARERASRAAAQSGFAALTEQLARQNVSARNTYESILNRLDQEELQSRSQQGLAKLMQSLGG